MSTYLIRRSAQTVIFLFVAAFVLFTVLVMLMPDGPAKQYQRALAGDQTYPPPPSRVELERSFKTDRPWPVNFLAWLFDPTITTRRVIVTSDFGYTFTETDTDEQVGINVKLGPLQLRGAGMLTGDFGDTPLTEFFGDRWANTARLLLAAFIICVLIGVPVGILSAVGKGSSLDHVFTFGIFSVLSVPPFVLGLILIIFLDIVPQQLHFYSNWTWMPYLPSGGSETLFTQNSGTLGDLAYHLVLPALTLAIPQVALISRHVRFSLLEVLRQDYIRTAWSKGVPRWRIVVKHALRNTLAPIIVAITQAVTGLISTAIVVEALFAYPGVAHQLYLSLGGCSITQSMLSSQDPPACPANGFLPMNYPLALTLLLALLIVIAIFAMLADVLSTYSDPRISQKRM